MLRAAALGLVLFVGCATGESLDESGGGAAGTPAGGNSGTGATTSGGGNAGSATTGGGGSGGTGAGTSGGGTGGSTTGGSGGDDGGTCPLDQKNCSGTCVPLKNPYTGCSNADCKECPAPPANATSTCTTGLCDFKCNTGYTKSGSTCVSSGGGGTGGGGTGGTTSGGGGTTASGGGGTGGGTCSGACDPSNPAAHIICAGICALSGQSIGLCAPFLNCCLCSS